MATLRRSEIVLPSGSTTSECVAGTWKNKRLRELGLPMLCVCLGGYVRVVPIRTVQNGQ